MSSFSDMFSSIYILSKTCVSCLLTWHLRPESIRLLMLRKVGYFFFHFKFHSIKDLNGSSISRKVLDPLFLRTSLCLTSENCLTEKFCRDKNCSVVTHFCSILLWFKIFNSRNISQREYPIECNVNYFWITYIAV